MGVFEMTKFESGTKGVMDAVVAATKAGGVSIIGVCRINNNKLKLQQIQARVSHDFHCMDTTETKISWGDLKIRQE